MSNLKAKVIISPRFCKLMSVFINVYAITLYPFIISKEKLDVTVYNHEKIHLVQQRELWLIGFYLLYVYYWLLGKWSGSTSLAAYLSIPFEREAYQNEVNQDYLNDRKKQAWLAYR